MDSQEASQSKLVGAGGTPGGIGIFFLGVAMACAGGWLLTNQVTVSSQYFASGVHGASDQLSHELFRSLAGTVYRWGKFPLL